MLAQSILSSSGLAVQLPHGSGAQISAIAHSSARFQLRIQYKRNAGFAFDNPQPWALPTAEEAYPTNTPGAFDPIPGSQLTLNFIAEQYVRNSWVSVLVMQCSETAFGWEISLLDREGNHGATIKVGRVLAATRERDVRPGSSVILMPPFGKGFPRITHWRALDEATGCSLAYSIGANPVVVGGITAGRGEVTIDAPEPIRSGVPNAQLAVHVTAFYQTPGTDYYNHVAYDELKSATHHVYQVAFFPHRASQHANLILQFHFPA